MPSVFLHFFHSMFKHCAKFYNVLPRLSSHSSSLLYSPFCICLLRRLSSILLSLPLPLAAKPCGKHGAALWLNELVPHLITQHQRDPTWSTMCMIDVLTEAGALPPGSVGVVNELHIRVNSVFPLHSSLVGSLQAHVLWVRCTQ